MGLRLFEVVLPAHVRRAPTYEGYLYFEWLPFRCSTSLKSRRLEGPDILTNFPIIPSAALAVLDFYFPTN
jgi:hypothetical protein